MNGYVGRVDTPLRTKAERAVEHPHFERGIIALIAVSAVVAGLETSPGILEAYGDQLHIANLLIIGLFIVEAALKIFAVAPRFGRYFGNGWNLFDFTIVIASLIPAAGELALVARLVRVLRVLRLLTTVPQLRLIVATLVRSIPSMGHVILLLGVMFYIYGVAGYHLFHATDPERWGTLGDALLTLFQVLTLEGWAEIQQKAMEAYPGAWLFFMSFVVIGTFVVMNLFIAVVINNLEDSKVAQLEELRRPPTHDEILRELEATRQALVRLENKLQHLEAAPPARR